MKYNEKCNTICLEFLAAEVIPSDLCNSEVSYREINLLDSHYTKGHK